MGTSVGPWTMCIVQIPIAQTVAHEVGDHKIK